MWRIQLPLSALGTPNSQYRTEINSAKTNKTAVTSNAVMVSMSQSIIDSGCGWATHARMKGWKGNSVGIIHVFWSRLLFPMSFKYSDLSVRGNS